MCRNILVLMAMIAPATMYSVYATGSNMDHSASEILSADRDDLKSVLDDSLLDSSTRMPLKEDSLPVVLKVGTTPQPHPTEWEPEMRPIEGFLWTEVPNRSLRTIESWNMFYDNMRRFIESNSVNFRTTHVILRVLNPDFVSAGFQIWNNPAASPMYTQLISKLKNIQFRIYPYLGEEDDLVSWSKWGHNYLHGVYEFTSMWNAFLLNNACQPFSGIVLDGEEFRGREDELIPLIETVGSFPLIKELSISLGFDDYKRILKLRKHINTFYMQMYDWYTGKVSHISQSSRTSPFSLNPHSAREVVEFLKTEVFADSDLVEMYTTFAGRIYAMWSAQNAGSADCIHPLRGTCGVNYELGTWSPLVANHFLSWITNPTYGLFRKLRGHGLFEYCLVPNSWV